MNEMDEFEDKTMDEEESTQGECSLADVAREAREQTGPVNEDHCERPYSSDWPESPVRERERKYTPRHGR